LILVGVASDTVQLIAEHASITRCLRQIQMPLMNRQELTEIISKALPILKMTIDPIAMNYIVSLSQGLPHYTHLLGKEAALKAIRSQRTNITPTDVVGSVNVALEQIDMTIRDVYHKAATGPRTSELFPQVLLACALATTDHLGYFKSSDVRIPLCEITGEDYNIADFTANLEKLSSNPDRGMILEKIGEPRKYKYRFANPLLRPFTILKQMTSNQSLSQMILDFLLEGQESQEEEPPEQRSLFD
jgi:hypothetical protein